MLGVTRSLQERFGPEIAGMAAVGGASAGTFGGLLLAAGVDARRLHEDAHLDLVQAVARAGGPLFRCNERVYATFLAYLDAAAPDAHERASGRFHVSLSRVTARGVIATSKSEFADNADLVDAMIASAFVPVAYTSRPPLIFHRGRRDGRYYVDASVQDPRPTPLDEKTHPRLLLHHRMFRRDLPAFAPISCDAAVVEDRFQMGYADAEDHAGELTAAFPPGGYPGGAP